jgi:hypothetical protein
MAQDCEAAREDIDAYAIGALDVDEARALEAHLAGCEECAGLLEEARESGTALALSVPLVSSGPTLKARILASAAVLTPQTRRRLSAPWWQAAAAVLILLTAGTLVWGVGLQRRVDRLSNTNATVRNDASAQSDQLATVRTELVQMTDFNSRLAQSVGSQDAVIQIVSQPDVRRTQMEGTAAAPEASARYLWSASQNMGALVAANLPPLADGATYQMWAVYKDRWESGGRFAVDRAGSGKLLVDQIEPSPDGDAPLWFCVTVEPAFSNASTHTGPMVLRSGGT